MSDLKFTRRFFKRHAAVCRWMKRDRARAARRELRHAVRTIRDGLADGHAWISGAGREVRWMVGVEL